MTFGAAIWQVRSNLGHPSLVQLLEDLKKVLDDDAHTSKHTFINRTQQWCGICVLCMQHIECLEALIHNSIAGVCMLAWEAVIAIHSMITNLHAMHAAALQSSLAPTASWCASSLLYQPLRVPCLLTLPPQDIARATFCRLTEDIHALKARYQELHRLNNLKVLTCDPRSKSHSPHVSTNTLKAKDWTGGFLRALRSSQMQYSARRGFYLVLQPSDDPQPSASSRSSGATARGLPHGFQRLDVGRARSRGIPCTTHELTALNGRLRSAADDCLVLTEQVLQTIRQSGSL